MRRVQEMRTHNIYFHIDYSKSVGEKVVGKSRRNYGISVFFLGTNRSCKTQDHSRIDFIRAGIIDAMEFMNKVFPLIIEVPLLFSQSFSFYLLTVLFLTREREMEMEKERKRVSHSSGRIESHGLSSISFFPPLFRSSWRFGWSLPFFGR